MRAAAGLLIAEKCRRRGTVAQTILLELKTVDRIPPVHETQMRKYLRLSSCQIALLMNFNAVLLKDDLRRFIP